jgi:hypothetical protein
MRKDFERRLRQIEIADAGCDAIEVWIDQSDGTVCGPRGERLTRQAFDHAYPRGRACGGGVVLVIGAQDARL